MIRLLPLVFLVGCVTAPPKVSVQDIQRCDGRTVPMRVTEVTAHLPAFDCVALAQEHGAPALQVLLLLLTTPLACAIWADDGSWGIVVLPPWAPDWMREHEFDHLRGLQHPTLLPSATECEA